MWSLDPQHQQLRPADPLVTLHYQLTEVWQRCSSTGISEEVPTTRHVVGGSASFLEGNKHHCHDQRPQPLLRVILVRTIRTNLRNAIFMHWWNRAECQHKCFLLRFLGLTVTLCLCEKCTSRGRFGKNKALDVAVDLRTASTVVMMLAWALQEALGSLWDPGDKCLPTRARHLWACPPGQPASRLQGLLLFKRQLSVGHDCLRYCFFRAESTASTSELVCKMVLLPGAQLSLLSYQWFQL